MSRPEPRPSRAPLARTLSGARWAEYRTLLADARAAGYGIRSLEDWLDAPGDPAAPVLLLRHDVDQHPRSALAMAEVEAQEGVTSTYYLRWRTANARVIERLRAGGHRVGLHYETLSRHARERGLRGPEALTPAVIEHGREVLASEIAAFSERHGPIASICPHGDSSIGWVDNVLLVRAGPLEALGVRWDGRETATARGLGLWLTDRREPGGWSGGAVPRERLAAGVSPILCVTHPNHWVSGASLWGDRALSRATGAPSLGGVRERAACTGTDEPPVAA